MVREPVEIATLRSSLKRAHLPRSPRPPERPEARHDLAERSGIAHRCSFFEPEGETDAAKFYRPGAFPDTGARMKLLEAFAPPLATEAVDRLLINQDRRSITHLIVTCCTGFFAPGIDLQLIDRCGLTPDIERTFVGFMGCYAAINGLKLARHIVRSEPGARVLAMNLELCTLHLHETTELEEILSFLLFGDGCAAALVSADPVGLRMDSFKAALIPETAELIRWSIRNKGFDMVLSEAFRALSAAVSPMRAPASSRGMRRSICGRCIPEDDRYWMPCRARSTCRPRPWMCREASCATSAICPRAV
jgi:predicted naringenin-chalcone synthase